MIENTFITENEAAKFIGITPRTLRLWRRTRGVPYYKITWKVVRYKADDILRWLEKHRTSTKS